MSQYRCFFIGANGRVAAAPETIDAPSHEEARAQATTLLAASKFPAAELWLGAERVFQIVKPGKKKGEENR